MAIKNTRERERLIEELQRTLKGVDTIYVIQRSGARSRAGFWTCRVSFVLFDGSYSKGYGSLTNQIAKLFGYRVSTPRDLGGAFVASVQGSALDCLGHDLGRLLYPGGVKKFKLQEI